MYDRIRSNKRKTMIVVTLFALLVVAVASIAGYALFGSALVGGIVGGLVGLIYVTISINTASGSMLKRAGAKQVTADQNKDENIKERQAYNIVSQLAMMQCLPEPEVYVIEDDQPNSFAAGLKPENAKVAVTTGLLERLNRAEIEGVIAHEIAHIQNYDSRLKVTTFALGGVIGLIRACDDSSKLVQGRWIQFLKRRCHLNIRHYWLCYFVIWENHCPLNTVLGLPKTRISS